MKNTLFVSTLYNGFHFISLQAKTFQKFVQDEYDYCVVDDADHDTRSLLTGNLASEDNKKECEAYGVRHIPIPQSIHRLERDGGLIPNDSPNIHHTTERHSSLLKYILLNHKALGFDQYKTVVLLDIDMFIRKPVNISEYMEDYDMLGAGREQTFNISALSPDQRSQISRESIDMDGQKIHFYTMCLLFINMAKINNLETFDNRSYRAITDTGAHSHIFIKNNPQYKFGFLKDWNSGEYRCDFFSKHPPRDQSGNETEPEILHYRAGSNWSAETKQYYFEKLHRMLDRYLPEFAQKYIEIDNDVTSSNGEHTLLKNGEIISKYGA